MDQAPLILTLALDAASQAFFERARRQWFPPRLNVIPAHVTMFHHLPGESLDAVMEALAEACRAQGPAAVAVTGLRFLGRGVAYELQAPEVAALRGRFAREWADRLTPQDRQPWRPHVTVQNKVPPDEARRLLARLSQEFVPFAATATGLALWHYLGGPWEMEAILPFAAEPDTASAGSAA